jgi:hypothetical protein
MLRELAARLAVFALTVAVVVGTATVAPQVLDIGGGEDAGDAGPPPLEIPEYDAAALAATPPPARGEIKPSAGPGRGLVVIDAAHANRMDREDIGPVVDALVRKGHRVEFTDDDESLGSQLDDAKAFVVVDPGREFPDRDVRAVQRFTDRGGHLLVAGEPTRRQMSDTGGQISSRESKLTTLLSAYRMSVDTQYLYNLETNGGNYRHVVADPPRNADLNDVGRVTLFTAAEVESRTGRTLLRTARGTRRADSDTTRRYPVAVQQENVLVLGDSTLMRPGRYNVGDNERFLGHVVSFLLEGERVSMA